MKISTKITLATTVLFLVIIGTIALVLGNFLISTIEKDTMENLKISTQSYNNEFENSFTQVFSNINTYSDFFKENFTLKQLNDYETILAIEPEMEQLGRHIVRGQNILNIYAWFLPDYVPDEWLQISVRNVDMDGNITYVNTSKYTNEDLKEDSWNWLTTPIEKGMNITDPYKFADYDDRIVTIAAPLEIEGKKVGVVGCDTFITVMKKRVLSTKILDTGYYAFLIRI